MASRLFTVDLDLGLNKAKRFIFEDFSSAPTGTTGRVIYWTAGDSDSNHLKVYNGTSWKTLAYTDDVPSISIGLDAATGFNVTGSPSGANGTLTFEWNTVSPNYVLAGNVSGSTSAIPTFRSLVDADIPVEIARVADLPSAGTDYIAYSEKGADLGVAELDADGYVPASQLNLTNYVTLDGTQTISGTKTFTDKAKFGNGSGSVFYIQSELTGGMFDEHVLNIASTGMELTPTHINIGTGIIQGSSIGMSTDGPIGIATSSGDFTITGANQYIGSADPNNQIATIGDIDAISTTITGTTNEIEVTTTGTNDYVIGLPNDVTITNNLEVGGQLVFEKDISGSPTAYLSSLTSGGVDSLITINSNWMVGISGEDHIWLSSTNGAISLSGATGEFLNDSSDPNNQIAVIGDLSSFITGYTETDPIYTASSWYTTTNNALDWDTAYGWGDHSTAGYLTSITNLDGNIDIIDSQINLADTIGVMTVNAISATASLFDNAPSYITIGTTTDDIQIGSVTSTLTVNNDLVVTGDLTVNGDVTTLNTTTVNVEDNIFVLNSNVTGTPSANSGIEVERGTSTNASLIWNETSEFWTAGLAGSEVAIARKYVTTTTGTTHTVTHNLGTSDVTVNCWVSGEQIEASVVVTDANTVTVTTNSSLTVKTVVVG